LPLGLVDDLPVLLFVLGNLCACLIDGNILGLCQDLYRALARSFLSRVSLVSAARTAAVAASRKAAGSVPPLALRIDWSMDAKGSELRARVGATT
jgi:hypothetical protein